MSNSIQTVTEQNEASFSPSHFVSPVPPACHMCPLTSSVPFTFPSQGSSCNLIPYSCTQYPSWDTKPMITCCSVLFFTFVTFIPALFVRLTSVCMSYPKLSLQLKWKSSLYPRDFRAIISDSYRHSCHVGCFLQNLMVALPFSPGFYHKHYI